ncbi:MBL fold metallo-hydrolase [Chloroflexota bacterium]
MKVTILGTSAAYPGPGEACSGFLVEEDNKNLLLDCGAGVLSNLQKYIDLRDVQDILITHMHADHFFDLIHYRYALRYGLENTKGLFPKVHLPPGGTEVLNQVVSPFAESECFFSDVFELSEYNPNEPLQLGSIVLRFAAVRHYITAYALSITGTRKLAYTSDSGFCPELVQVAKDADLLLCNAGRCLGADINHLWGHLLPEEAGELASIAGAKRLLLTHLWPTCDRALSLEKASNAFEGLVEIAEACRTFEL